MIPEIRSVYDRYISIRLSLIVLAFLVIALSGSLYFYVNGSIDTKLGSLLGGLVATFIAVLIQFLLTLSHHREIERLKRMGFKDILANRHDRKDYYADLINGARKRIDFLGKTSRSFLSDFAFDDDGAAPRDRLLLDALNRGVRVRVLATSRDMLPAVKQRDHDYALARMEYLSQKYPRNFQYRFTNSTPGQTYVLADSRCIFGPVFPSISSRITPAIHADRESPFLDQYIRYFEDEWRSAAKGTVHAGTCD